MHCRYPTLALLLALLLPTAAPAVMCPGEEQQEETPAGGSDKEKDSTAASAARSKWKTGLRNVGADARYMVTFPTRITRRGVIMTSAFGAGLAGLLLLDQEIFDGNRGEERLESIKEIEDLGGFYQTHLAVLATYGGGRLAHHEPTIETSKAMLEALLFTDVVVGVGKAAFGRDGPENGRASDWFSFEDSGRFPSGHTARAFTLATVLSERHGKVAAWISYPLATLVALSLIDSEDHWASDTFAGAALGHVVGRAVVRRRQERSGRRVRLEPVILQRDGGMGMMVRITIPQRSARRGQ